ncbi:MAG: cold-shock protein [Oceanospirillaceae bacterium]|uniref:cold shock domain-containing protein n=1 Tax=unclassified Thalassolituus TaxID=2624967 RepID=UPI000C618922|nr:MULTISPECIES: cold shock domain-containing protein [unclassified Thalassolituus]MAS24936.1 cold-shock protein [Oceanospirillaceae bacterium]MAY01159.1 cold-shock protein [Oceanospirillaceae bacterium]MBL35143.1 cold-shock protein [Oceanospirillaceae bacterium]MBS52326.1 cold-shock protein [Oceanospirillaceae bacterium]
MLRRILIALVSAVLLAGLVAVVLPKVVTGLQVEGSVMAIEGMKMFLFLVAVFGFVISIVSVQLSPSRRRRFRNSGTVVEQDVEDGRERGVVKWFNVKKGFGFITWDEGEDVFVHFRSIRGQGHRSLTEGQRVKFTVVRGQKGPQAEDVSAVR